MEIPFWGDRPVLTDSMSWIPFDEKVAKAFVMEDRYEEKMDLSLIARFDDKIWLGIPRNCALLGSNDMRVQGDTIDINCIVPPRNTEQSRVISEIIGHFDNDQSHVFRATTGFGKTYVALAVTSIVKRPTLIVVTKEDLMDQWTKAILGDGEKPGYLDLTDDEVGYAQGDICDYTGKKIVIGMVHSLSKDRYGDAFKRHFGLVIFDEVHRMGADTFSEVCKQFPAKYRLGLSATPTRTDGRDFVFQAHIGPVTVVSDLQQMPLKVLVKRTGWKLPFKTQYIKRAGGWEQFNGPLIHEMDRMMGVYKAMAESAPRNQLLTNVVKAAYEKDRRTIVFSHLRGHLEQLCLDSIGNGIPSEEMGFYMGGMSEKTREIAKTKRVLWATYNMTKEATDIPILDTAVLATPIAHPKQAVGRVLREVEGKKGAVVVDLFDDASEILRKFYSSRLKEYSSLHADVIEL